MTTNLIPVQQESISGTIVSTVDARTLHTFLEVGKVFAAWITERVEQYGFVEEQDFVVVISNSGKNPQGGRPTKEYHMTLDMAKEMSMVERNEQGRKARRYFIQKEKEALGLAKPDLAATLDILFYEAAIRNLNVSDAGKIKMLSTITEMHGRPAPYLPTYTEERITKSLTALLKEYQPEMSVRTAYPLLVANGLIEIKTRDSMKKCGDGKTKKASKQFKSLTDRGLRYGKNLINPHNEKETQPHFYEETFPELLDLLNGWVRQAA